MSRPSGQPLGFFARNLPENYIGASHTGRIEAHLWNTGVLVYRFDGWDYPMGTSHAADIHAADGSKLLIR